MSSQTQTDWDAKKNVRHRPSVQVFPVGSVSESLQFFFKTTRRRDVWRKKKAEEFVRPLVNVNVTSPLRSESKHVK